MKKQYNFTNNGRCVLIHTPVPPRQWLNYLWNDDGYLASISQQGSGESRYLTPDMQLEKMSEKRSRFLFLRDDVANVSWNPGFAPLYVALDEYECEHSLAYTEIRSKKNGIAASIRFVVPEKGLHEIWKVIITNTTDKVRKLSAFAAVDMDITGEFPQPRYYHNGSFTTMTFEESLNGIYGWANNPYAPHDKYKAFLASSLKVDAYDCSTTAFTGGDVSFSHPLTVLEGRDCSNSTTVYDCRTAVLQNKLTLQPGETKVIFYASGFCSSVEDARANITTAFAPGHFEDIIAKSENDSIRSGTNERVNALVPSMNIFL